MASGEALVGSVGGWLEERFRGLRLPGWASLYILAVALAAASIVAGNDPVLVVALPLVLRVGCSLGFDSCSSAALLTVSVNVLSAVSPLGNPQNMIIASIYGVGFGFFVGCLSAWALASLLLLAPYALLLSRLGGRGCGESRVPGPCCRGSRGLAVGLAGSLTVAVGVETGLLFWAGLAALVLTGASCGACLRRLDLRLLGMLAAVLAVGSLAAGVLEEPLGPLLSRGPLGVYVAGLLLSQAVGNVPAAAALSQLHVAPCPLALGVNAGGSLALTSSLALLIAARRCGSPLRLQLLVAPVGVAAALLGLLAVGGC